MINDNDTILLSQHDAQLDYYGTKLATCSSDRSIRLFDVTNNQQTLITTLKGLVLICKNMFLISCKFEFMFH